MIHSPIRHALLALTAFVCLAPGSGAVPLVFHPQEELAPLRLFPHGGDVVITWGHGISHIDAESLTITDIDTAHYYMIPLPVAGSEEFFYVPFGSGPDPLKALRGTTAEVLAEQVDPWSFGAAGGHLFFTTYLRGLDVWSSDGTPAGTGMLANADPSWVNPCIDLCPSGSSYPSQIQVAPNGRIYFVAATRAGTDLWTRDPAAQFPGLPPTPQPATRRLAELGNDPLFSLVAPDGRLFFMEDGPFGPALWISDGSVAGTVRLASFPGIVGGQSAPIHDPVVLDGKLYFLAEASASRQLWRSDGTTAGTGLVRDFGLGPRIGALWTDGARLYFPFDAGGVGEELWSSDGSSAGTAIVADVGPGLAGGKPRSFAPLPDGRFLISLDDGVHGQEPWISDGTAAGTELLADARPGPTGSKPTDFVLAGNRLFFVDNYLEASPTPSYIEFEELAEVCAEDFLCLQDGRFRVEIFWTATGDSGKGKRAVASDEAGLFSFFSPDNWEVMVKVLDGCAINGHFWVFAAAATDVSYEIRVTDLETGQVRNYSFAGGSPAPATTDIQAFDTCSNLNWWDAR